MTTSLPPLQNPARTTLSELFDRHGLDFIWIKSLVAIRHLVGFSGSTAQLLCHRDGRRWLFVDGRYTLQASQECPGVTVIEIKKLQEDLCATWRELKIARLGVESTVVTLFDQANIRKHYPELELELMDENFALLRSIKTPEELSILRQGNEAANRAFDDFLGWIKPGVTEAEAAWFIDRRFRELGGTGNSFETLVAAGERSAIVHGKPTDRAIPAGELLIVDRGMIYHGFATDETNTLVLGKATPRQKEIYAVVKEAHDKSLSAVRPGVGCKDLDLLAREVIEKAGYGSYFGHGTGHGVGMDVHERPLVSPNGEGVIEEGMVFSIEPGIYIPGYGGVRIEDVVVVTSDGCEVLSRADKEHFELG